MYMAVCSVSVYHVSSMMIFLATEIISFRILLVLSNGIAFTASMIPSFPSFLLKLRFFHLECFFMIWFIAPKTVSTGAIRAVARQKVHPQVFLLCQIDHQSWIMHACINLALVLDHFLRQLLRCSKFSLLASRRGSNLASSLFYLWNAYPLPSVRYWEDQICSSRKTLIYYSSSFTHWQPGIVHLHWAGKASFINIHNILSDADPRQNFTSI